MLPRLLLIFSSPSSSISLCIQIGAMRPPRAPSDWAISFSWCGKTRSIPPPCTAKPCPRAVSAIAEHSMCQPGRPGPHGESHHVSSPSLRPFQRAKSRGDSFPVPGLLEIISSRLPAREAPVAGEALDAVVDVAVGGVGEAPLDQRRDQGDDLGDRLRDARLGVRAAQAEPVGVGDVGVRVAPRELLAGHALGAGGVVDLVVDVGQVRDEPHPHAAPLQVALQHREDHEGPGVADVDAPVDRRAADVDAARSPSAPGASGSLRLVRVEWRRTPCRVMRSPAGRRPGRRCPRRGRARPCRPWWWRGRVTGAPSDAR